MRVLDVSLGIIVLFKYQLYRGFNPGAIEFVLKVTVAELPHIGPSGLMVVILTEGFAFLPTTKMSDKIVFPQQFWRTLSKRTTIGVLDTVAKTPEEILPLPKLFKVNGDAGVKAPPATLML